MNPAIRLLLSNKSWSQEHHAIDPEFFKQFTSNQQPEFLWITCSDSRISVNELTATDPGELFVHRNIANMIGTDDVNSLSVIQYAVENLKVNHVIVCGHYGCGGIKAALDGGTSGVLDNWLQPAQELCKQHRGELDHLSAEEQWTRLVELNAIHQVQRLAQTSIIQAEWARRGRPYLHGWVYALSDGILHPLITLTPEGPVDLDSFL